MIAATCVPWPNRSAPSPPVKSTSRPRARLSALCRVSIPESITATRHARARQRRQLARARPHLIGADRSRGHSASATESARRPTGDRSASSLQRLQLAGVDPQHARRSCRYRFTGRL